MAAHTPMLIALTRCNEDEAATVLPPALGTLRFLLRAGTREIRNRPNTDHCAVKIAAQASGTTSQPNACETK
jgi:hypothetical protein